MNDRTFNREQIRRKLTEILDKVDKATEQEAEGNFTEMESSDMIAAVMLTVISIEVGGALEDKNSYCGEVMQAIKEKEGL